MACVCVFLSSFKTLQRLVQEYQLPNMLLGDFQFYKAAARSAVECIYISFCFSI